MTNEFFEFESPGFDCCGGQEFDEEEPRGSGVMEMLGWFIVFLFDELCCCYKYVFD